MQEKKYEYLKEESKVLNDNQRLSKIITKIKTNF